ncbi:hypothetical protein SDC9_58351 [bioreactor metagenome]|uniref:Uncharacterized protein n=1 Tax=bioreactor metagenome TaxID=1076179 RepID=A0A644X758_9ZZZZ
MEKSPKVIVSVFAMFDTEGKLSPVSFVWEDGTKYMIDKVLDVRRAASLKAGGAGVRYTCMVCGRQTYLYLEEDRWFMERRGS